MLYHHTDSARLPWILKDGALKAGRNQIGGYPSDFLWATTDPMGDPTAASAINPEGYRSGMLAAVRFAVPDEDFESWEKLVARDPRWRSEHVLGLVASAIKMGATPSTVAKWRARIEPQPSDRWRGIEFRTWRNPRWRPVPPDAVCVGTDCLAIKLDQTIFYSQQRILPGQPTAYAVKKEALQ